MKKSIKIGTVEISEEQIKGIMNLSEMVAPLIDRPDLTADPKNRSIIYAFAKLCVNVMPILIMDKLTEVPK